MWRDLLALKRDRAALLILVLQTIVDYHDFIIQLEFPFELTIFYLKIMGVMYGLMFSRIDLDQEGIQNINSLLFLSIVYVSVIHLFSEVKVRF